MSFNGNKDGHKIGFLNIPGKPSIPDDVEIKKLHLKGKYRSKKSLTSPEKE